MVGIWLFRIWAVLVDVLIWGSATVMAMDMGSAEDEYLPFSPYQAFVTLGVFYVPLALASIRAYFSWKLSPKSIGYVYPEGWWARLGVRFGPPARTYADGMVLMLLLIGSCFTVSWCFGQNAGKIYRLIAYLDNSPGEEVWVIGRREFELVDAPAIALLGNDAKNMTHLEVSPVNHPEERMAFISPIPWSENYLHKELKLRVHKNLFGMRWLRSAENVGGSIHDFRAYLAREGEADAHSLEKYHGKVLVFVSLLKCNTQKPAPAWLQTIAEQSKVQLFRSGDCEPPVSVSSLWFALTNAPTSNLRIGPENFRKQAIIIEFYDRFGLESGVLEDGSVTVENILREINKAALASVPYEKMNNSP
jgi:hypothetical protein